MYLENYYYLKSYFFFIDKICSPNFNRVHNLKQLSFTVYKNEKRKTKIISFLILKFMGFNLIKNKSNIVIHLVGDYKIFSFFTNLILI